MNDRARSLEERATRGDANVGSRTSAARHTAAWFADEVAVLNPGCFALVMATGIISNAFYLEGLRPLADALLAVNLVAYPCLWLLTIFRLEAATLALWAWATWWIPLLVLLGIWKHGVHRVPIHYTTMLWSIVFPLGMYAATTFRLSRLVDFPALAAVSRVMALVALAAWAATAIGLAAASLRSVRTAAAAPK